MCWDNVELGGLQSRRWREDRLVLAVHPEHPLAKRRTIAFEELPGAFPDYLAGRVTGRTVVKIG